MIAKNIEKKIQMSSTGGTVNEHHSGMKRDELLTHSIAWVDC